MLNTWTVPTHLVVPISTTHHGDESFSKKIVVIKSSTFILESYWNTGNENAFGSYENHDLWAFIFKAMCKKFIANGSSTIINLSNSIFCFIIYLLLGTVTFPDFFPAWSHFSRFFLSFFQSFFMLHFSFSSVLFFFKFFPNFHPSLFPFSSFSSTFPRFLPSFLTSLFPISSQKFPSVKYLEGTLPPALPPVTPLSKHHLSAYCICKEFVAY